MRTRLTWREKPSPEGVLGKDRCSSFQVEHNKTLFFWPGLDAYMCVQGEKDDREGERERGREREGELGTERRRERERHSNFE